MHCTQTFTVLHLSVFTKLLKVQKRKRQQQAVDFQHYETPKLKKTWNSACFVTGSTTYACIMQIKALKRGFSHSALPSTQMAQCRNPTYCLLSSGSPSLDCLVEKNIYFICQQGAHQGSELLQRGLMLIRARARNSACMQPRHPDRHQLILQWRHD